MLQQLLAIARNALVESIRQPIFFVLVLLAGVFQVFITWSTAFSMGYSTSAEVHGDNKQLLEIGMASVFTFGMLLAAFVATAVMSREIENKTVLTVVSKPVARPALVVGKFLGVAGAILVAVLLMLLFLMLSLRHEVMSTAADDLDGPVIVFGFGAALLAIGVGVVGNYLYGWHFSQASMLTMAPLMLLAYAGVLCLGKKWNLQPPGTDFKPQVATACAALVIALMVLTAVAASVSTRLGQVMTIVVCVGVFLGGLLSNHYFGRRAFRNHHVGLIESAVSPVVSEAAFNTPGATLLVTLQAQSSASVRVGMPFLYGPSPNGFPMTSPSFTPYTGDPKSEQAMMSENTAPALVVTAVEGRVLTVRNIGHEAVRVGQPPRNGDYIFAAPTRISPVALAVWGVVPNMHSFWLPDAVTQNRPVPLFHLGLIGVYGVFQITAWLGLGVVLFQKRDVG
ncbi:MAG: ABC transporter permease [Phycisphaerales bacterium]